MKEKISTKSIRPVVIDFENKKLSSYYFLPLLLIAGIVPLIVSCKYIDLTGTTQFLYWTGQNQYLDFFSYNKSRYLIIFTAIAFISYFTLYNQKKLPLKGLKHYYIPIGIYAVFAVLSTIFAKDTSTAMWGFVDMYQGILVLLSYVIITFLAINFVNNDRDVSLFIKVFLFLMITEGLIGISQYFGFDFFKTDIGKNIIIPSNIKVSDLSFSFGPKTIYGTLFNTNFVGSFAGLMLPLAVAALLISKTKKQKMVSGIAVLLMIFIWIGCNSRAGYVGVAVSVLFALWLFRKMMVKHWKITVSFMAVLIVAFIGFNSISDGAIFSRLKTLNVGQEISNIKVSNENSMKFEEIALGQDSFSIKTNRETLNFKIDGRKILFLDENNMELSITKNENSITINDERYSNYNVIIPEEYSGVTVVAYGKTIKFFVAKEGVKIIGSGGRLAEQKTSPFFEPLKGLERIGSNRGYIWGATIPMLKNYLIIGAGPDNYPIAFNQDDFIGKLNLIDVDANIVVDKPHNMYLQTAVNTGVISLIALLALYGIYVVSSLMLYSKVAFNNSEEIIGAACMISIIGYLAAGMFNDNVVSVAPLFWLILGLGISINLRVKNKLNIEKQ